MCPAIDSVISLDRVALRDGSVIEAVRAIARLVRKIRTEKFDLVIDFHGFRETNLLAWVSGAQKRLGLQRFDAAFLSFCFNLPPIQEDKLLHAGEVFMRVVESLGCRKEPGKALRISDSDRQWAQSRMTRGAVVLYVDAPVPERIWPSARFAAVADVIVERYGVPVVVVAGPQGHSLIEAVNQASQDAAKLQCFTGITISQLAAIIDMATLLISNDTGPMHLGPALGVPTLGIFSVGFPEHFRPRGARDRYLRGNPIDMVGVDEVLRVVEQMWVTAAGQDLLC